MTIQSSRIPAHWNYFLCIEDDLLELSRWIEFCPENFNCYSIEVARLLMTCSQEADVIASRLCANISASAKATKINAYRTLLTTHFPKISSTEVHIARFGLILKPWENWSRPNTPPDWWTANNKVKHERGEHFHQASLKNTLNAAAGLFTLLILYYQGEQSLSPAPRIFESDRYAQRINDTLFLHGKG